MQAGLRSDYAMELFLASKLLLACGATLTFLYVNSRLVNGLVFPHGRGGGGLDLRRLLPGPNLWLGSRIGGAQARPSSGRCPTPWTCW